MKFAYEAGCPACFCACTISKGFIYLPTSGAAWPKFGESKRL